MSRLAGAGGPWPCVQLKTMELCWVDHAHALALPVTMWPPLGLQENAELNAVVRQQVVDA